MNEDELDLLVDLDKRQWRQGPGGEAETQQAIDLAGLNALERMKIADIGCGTGASTLQLAQSLQTEVTAVDFLPEFIDILMTRAADAGVSERISTLVCTMEQLPFADESLDVIWSEGAIYNMGFERGVNEWRRFLKPGGALVVSEITWMTDTRPTVLQDHWTAAYPEIDTASSKIGVLERSGYTPVGYFTLPENCWRENYYAPLLAELPAFEARHAGSELAGVIADGEREEATLYDKYKAYYSYGVYVARKLP